VAAGRNIEKKLLRIPETGSSLPYSTTLYHYDPLDTTSVSGFLGRYDYQMDEKGRVSLPAAFRKEAEGGRFILIQWEKPYLTLFPEEVWAKVQERLLEYRRADPGAGNYIREITANALEVSPDKQGRILIPAWLQEAASLKGTVVLNGVIDRVEIWDPEEFQKVIQERAEESQTFRHQIFG
jgi:MraZ protein